MPSKKVDKAAQFKAFDALKGFREELKKAEEIYIESPTYLDDKNEELQNIFTTLNLFEYVQIKYHQNGKIYTVVGTIKEISLAYKFIIINNLKIKCSDIIDIKKEI